MSKFLVALLVLGFVCVALGGRRDRNCREDSCRNKGHGMYQSNCGPCSRYYKCGGKGSSASGYGYCSGSHNCIMGGGKCGSCLDSCRGKRNGNYPSADNPRPFYYSCYNGHYNEEMCHPNEIFNAWSRKCECYELFCEMGDGYQPSMCGNGNCQGYVLCKHGFAVTHKTCRGSKPYFCCETHKCRSRKNKRCSCGGGGH